MKNLLLALFLLAVGLTACKKEPNGGTTPVEFKQTDYSYMGEYDAQGKPNYLVTKDVVSNNLLNYIKEQMPETSDIRKSHPEYLKNADLAVTAKADVFITFVSEGTAYANSVGYYTYTTGNPPKQPEDIKNIIYMFPHAQSNNGGTLTAGDKVKLGTFDAGTSIGFVLLQKGWDAATRTVNKKVPHFCSNKELNPENLDELKAHTVLFDYASENKKIIGFEDIDRSMNNCDHDFNDVVMYATVKAL